MPLLGLVIWCSEHPFVSLGCKAGSLYCSEWTLNAFIDDIEQLEEMFEAPDIRPLSASDVSAANRRHDEMLANSPWFRLWQDFGICCRPENPMLSETERR
jgi:hypothetical protein